MTIFMLSQMNYGEADGDMELGVIPQQQLVKSGSMGSYKGARNHKVTKLEVHLP